MATDPLLVVFGATGDLTKRLLLPALGALLAREPERTLRLVGAGRDDVPDDDWRELVAEAFADHPSATAEQIGRETTYHDVDMTDRDAIVPFLRTLSGDPVVLYFAVPPQVAADMCETLEPGDLPEHTILAMEKPFGSDEASARELNVSLRDLLPENDIFRVDHFLGQSSILHVLGVRFANRIFQPVWNGENIERIEIVYDEALALEGRAGYYDSAGALVDMIQSHLLQVLAVIAMEPPATMDEADVRDAIAATLRATHLWEGDASAASARARYTAGEIDGKNIPDYTSEEGVDPENGTETLAEITVEVRNERWAGVPFTLRSGKAIQPARKQAVVTFRPVRHLPTGFTGSQRGSVVTFDLAPDAITLDLNVNAGTDLFELDRATLATQLGEDSLPAYAEVLSAIFDRDPVLSVRGDVAEQCWRIVDPVLRAWRADEVPLDEYEAGSAGPKRG